MLSAENLCFSIVAFSRDQTSNQEGTRILVALSELHSDIWKMLSIKTTRNIPSPWTQTTLGHHMSPFQLYKLGIKDQRHITLTPPASVLLQKSLLRLPGLKTNSTKEPPLPSKKKKPLRCWQRDDLLCFFIHSSINVGRINHSRTELCCTRQTQKIEGIRRKGVDGDWAVLMSGSEME